MSLVSLPSKVQNTLFKNNIRSSSWDFFKFHRTLPHMLLCQLQVAVLLEPLFLGLKEPCSSAYYIASDQGMCWRQRRFNDGSQPQGSQRLHETMGIEKSDVFLCLSSFFSNRWLEPYVSLCKKSCHKCEKSANTPWHIAQVQAQKWCFILLSCRKRVLWNTRHSTKIYI